jgi:hypothetical protein
MDRSIQTGKEMATITIALHPETEQKLREKARSVGITVDVYLRQLAERDVANGTKAPPPGRTFDEILAPVREEALQDPMTDEEIASLTQEARQAAQSEKHTVSR